MAEIRVTPQQLREKADALELLNRIKRYPRAATDVGVEGQLKKAQNTQGTARAISGKNTNV